MPWRFGFSWAQGPIRHPERMLRLKKKDKALLIQVPDGQVLYLNLLVSAYGGTPLALPREFAGAPQIWRARLRDGRSVALLGRVMPFDEQSTGALRHIRSELQPKANFTGSPPTELPYMEVVHAFWGGQGNVLLVIPMGPESRRFDPDDLEMQAAAPRPVTVECADANADLIAPDGTVVGSLSISGGSGRVSLIKGREVIHALGRATLAIRPGALRWGESFVRARSELECFLTVDGAKPKRWEYGYGLSFDGSTVSLLVSPISAALRNGNLKDPIPALANVEEILIRAPTEALRLTADRGQPEVTAELTCGFRLRDL